MVADVAAAVRLYAPSFAFLPLLPRRSRVQPTDPPNHLLLWTKSSIAATSKCERPKNLTKPLWYTTNCRLKTSRSFQYAATSGKAGFEGAIHTLTDGRGATSRELAAAMLFYDEKSPGSALKIVEEMLGKFGRLES